MLGFLFGSACLVGLFWVLRGGRHGVSFRCGRGSHRRWHGDERGPGFMLRWLFERLDTTPGQEKVIRGAADELFDKLRGTRQTLRETRSDVARAFRADDFNAEILGDVFARHDGALDDLRKTAVGSLARVHDALEPAQRARLAELLESMPGRGWGGGPYRSWG